MPFSFQESLAKAQGDFGQWQKAKAPGDRKRLASDVEDECKSISWQVGLCYGFDNSVSVESKSSVTACDDHVSAAARQMLHA